MTLKNSKTTTLREIRPLNQLALFRAVIFAGLYSLVMNTIAAECQPIRINGADSDAYDNQAQCGTDRQLIGTGEINIHAGGYVELTDVATGAPTKSRIRCENNTDKPLRLQISQAPNWPARVSAEHCNWSGNKLICEAPSYMVCAIETLQTVNQTVAISAVVHMRSAFASEKQQSDIAQIRAWLDSQSGIVDFCRQNESLDWPVTFKLVISKSGQVTVNTNELPNNPTIRLANCVAKRLARHTGVSDLSKAYSLDWQIGAPQ